jgi:hypothetical protein
MDYWTMLKSMMGPQQASDPNAMNDMYGVPQGVVDQAQNQGMLQFGMGLMAAGMPMRNADRPLMVANAMRPLGDVQTNIYNAAQARLMQQRAMQRKTITENVNGRVVLFDAETGEPIKDLGEAKKTGDIASSIEEYEYYVAQERAGGREPMPYGQWKQANNKGTTVNLNSPQQDNIGKYLDEETAKVWKKYKDQADTAGGNSQNLQMLQELIKIAPQGPITGRLASMFPGFSNAGAAVESIVYQMAPTLRVEGSGATSDLEYNGMLKSLPSLRNNPEANQFIAQAMLTKQQINIERGRLVTLFQTGRMTREEAMDKMDELNTRSILTPQLRQMIHNLGGFNQVEEPEIVQ